MESQVALTPLCGATYTTPSLPGPLGKTSMADPDDVPAPHPMALESGGTPVAEEKRTEMTVREAGKKGGAIVSQRYGKGFYEEIGKKGGSTTKQRYGADFYGEIGKKGGQTTAERHGPDFYEKIGKKGGQRVKELIEKGKANE